MKKWFLNNYKQYICVIISIILLAIVNVFFNNSNFGSDSIFCLNQGVSKFLKIEIGYATLIMNGLFVVIMLIINRKEIGVGTILTILFLGPLINIIIKLNIIPDLASVELPTVPYVLLQIAYILIALVLGGISISLFIHTNRGLSAFEGVLTKIASVTKIPFWAVKIISDIIFFIVGFLLGGTIHIGSIISAILYGPSISLFSKVWKKLNLFQERKNEKNF